MVGLSSSTDTVIPTATEAVPSLTVTGTVKLSASSIVVLG